jgi:hypothetical protein
MGGKSKELLLDKRKVMVNLKAVVVEKRSHSCGENRSLSNRFQSSYMRLEERSLQKKIDANEAEHEKLLKTNQIF